MSAFYGGFGATPEEVRAALVALRERSPDGSRIVELAPGVCVGVGIRRGGPEERWPAWDDARRWWVFLAGEPTNVRQLREELVARERVPPGASGARVFAELCADAGLERALARLEGEVAVLAWNADEMRLTLARDRSGACPATFDDRGRVASTGAALARGPVDVEGVAQAVALGVPVPPHTLHHGVTTLGAGRLVHLDRSGATVLAWWDTGVNPRGAAGAPFRWARSVEFATRVAIQHRLPEGRVAVAGAGAFARVVTAVAAERTRREAPVVLVFEASAPAGSVAVSLAPEEVPEALGDVAARGLFHPEALAWWALARAAWERDLPVLLTGVGGAAAHCPEPRSRRGRLLAQVGLARPSEPHWLGALAGDSPLAALEPLAAAAPEGEPDARALWLERRFLLAERDLATLDRLGALHQVSIRAPLADARLLSLLAEVPLEHLRARGVPRSLFDAAFPLTGGAAHAPLVVPLRAWLLGPLAAQLPDLADRLADVLDPAHVRWMTTRVHTGEMNLLRRVWALLALARWRERAAPG